MSDTSDYGPEYPVAVNVRVTAGLSEAILAVRRKRRVRKSAAIRQMLTAGALSILGADWRPDGAKGPNE